MTRTEFNKLLAELQTHAEAAKEIVKKLLDVVENDHVFKKKGTGYNVAEGDLVPKWEVCSLCASGLTHATSTAQSPTISAVRRMKRTPSPT